MLGSIKLLGLLIINNKISLKSLILWYNITKKLLILRLKFNYN
jgi:hypothetical protein